MSEKRVCEDPNTCDCEWTDREPYEDSELPVEKEKRDVEG